MTYTDWLGQEIKVGSPVLYAVSNGHYAQVVWGRVLEIKDVAPETRQIRDPNFDGPRWEAPIIGSEDYWPYDRKFKLKVQPMFQSGPGGLDDRGIDFEWDTPDGKWQEGCGHKYSRKGLKPVTIQNVEKVTVFELPPGVEVACEAALEAKLKARNERARQ